MEQSIPKNSIIKPNGIKYIHEKHKNKINFIAYKLWFKCI